MEMTTKDFDLESVQYPAFAQASQFVCESVKAHSSVPPSSGGEMFMKTLCDHICNDGHQGPRDEMDLLLLKYSVSQNSGVGMKLGKISQKQGFFRCDS